MAQIFTDDMGHDVYVTYVSEQWEPKGSMLARGRRLDRDVRHWAHGYCDRCRRDVAVPVNDAQGELFDER